MNLEDILAGWNGCTCSGGGGLTPYTVALSYAENVDNKDFRGGIEYDLHFGEVVESVIKLSNKFFFETSDGIEAGTYEILPLYEGGSGYFAIPNDTAATITGDASVVYVEDIQFYFVKVTGDCSITFTE